MSRFQFGELQNYMLVECSVKKHYKRIFQIITSQRNCEFFLFKSSIAQCVYCIEYKYIKADDWTNSKNTENFTNTTYSFIHHWKTHYCHPKSILFGRHSFRLWYIGSHDKTINLRNKQSKHLRIRAISTTGARERGDARRGRERARVKQSE